MPVKCSNPTKNDKLKQLLNPRKVNLAWCSFLVHPIGVPVDARVFLCRVIDAQPEVEPGRVVLSGVIVCHYSVTESAHIRHS